MATLNRYIFDLMQSLAGSIRREVNDVDTPTYPDVSIDPAPNDREKLPLHARAEASTSTWTMARL
jgi:hypothetical protein